MLRLEDFESGYGELCILHSLNLEVKEGLVHALMGRNGVGKSTTLKAIVGLIPCFSGRIFFDGRDLTGMKPYQVARLGLAYVPETRDIFGALSVRENLELAGRLAPASSPWTMDRVLSLFPRLAQRLNNGGKTLSGGEQQMLAIGRALMTMPRLLVLDEPTEGLAPKIVQQILAQLEELKRQGLSILLVEQNLKFAASLADEVSLMARGEIRWRGSAGDLMADEAAQHRWLGL